jgi:hypothetical protein
MAFSVNVTLQLTVSQSVSMSWCRAQSGTFDQRFFFKVTVLSFWGALSDERSGLSFVSLLSMESKVVSEFTYIIYNDIYIICVRHSSVIYNLYKIYIIQGLSQFRLCTADYALFTRYHGSLDTWTVVHMTVAKFKPLIFSVSGLALPNVTNIFIVMISDDFCLLPVWFCYVIINVRKEWPC